MKQLSVELKWLEFMEWHENSQLLEERESFVLPADLINNI